MESMSASLEAEQKAKGEALHALKAFRVCLVGMVEADLKLIDLSLKSLLDAERFTLGLLLSFQGGRHRLHGTGVVLPGVVELFLLLSHTPINLLLDLSKLKLSHTPINLLLLEGALGLLKGALELLLLLLEATPLLVQIMDGAATLTKLIQKILDLISEVLVLALDNVELFKSLILSSLQPEELRGVVAALILGGGNLGRHIRGLGLPFTQNLVKVLASLLSDQGSGMHPLVLHCEVIKLRVHPGLGLLGVGHLGGEHINQLLALHNLGLELVAGSLKLLNAAHALSLEARLPELDLSLGLGESLQGIGLPGILVLQLLPEVLQICGHHLVLGQKSGTVLVFGVSECLGVLQLSGHRDLALVHVGNSSLQLVNLAGEVLVLNLQPLLRRLSFVESACHLIEPRVGIDNVALEQLSSFVKLSLALDGVLQVTTGIAQVKLHVRLVLLGLHLVSAEAVNLLSKVSHRVVVLHAKSSQGSLVGNVQLLKLRFESGQLTFPLLVQLNLGGGVGAGLLQPGGNVLNVLLQHGAALLGLGAVSTLNGQLLVQLLKPGLKLLCLLGILGSESGLVVDLCGQSTALLVLASSSSLELTLDSFKVRDSLLGQFEVALNLPLGLFDVALDLLLTLKCVLSLVQGLLQLSLDTGQVVALVLGSLDVLLGLLATISTAPLFLAQLGDHVTLVGNLVLKGADLVVFVGSVLLSLGEVTLLDSNLALKLGHCSVGLGHSTLKSDLLGLLILDSGICLVKILLHIRSLIFNPDSFVNHVLNSRATGVQSQLQLVLLSSKAIVDGLDLGTRSNGSVNVGLSLGNLVLVLFLELPNWLHLRLGLMASHSWSHSQVF